MKLSIIIVSWNTRDLLEGCLASVYAHPPHGRFETIVVDNASSDGSVDMVRQKFPQVQLIAKEENVGFARGNNEAIPFCVGEYILLLNPDTVVKPEALAALTAFMDAHPNAGGAGSRLLNPDGSLQTSCYPAPQLTRELWRLFHLDAVYPYGEYHMHKWPTNAPRQVDVLKGASLIFRRAILEKVGFLDGAYFMYSEEVDLCFRVQKAGWRLYWVPQSQVMHYEGQSTKQMAADMFLQLYLGKLMYFRKHYGRFAGIVYKFILAAASLMRLALTPLALLQRPSTRQKNLKLAQRYGRLLTALPAM
ncbi:MAG: glycosyltransferase family 2 protein [Chloroflexi bacterium]|nr:glycosyltransferase family 2 protein [Chloroflexota bacterium]